MRTRALSAALTTATPDAPHARIFNPLPPTGFVRLPDVLRCYPVGKSTWWAMVRDGRAPAPVKLGQRCTAWRVEDIRALIEAAAPKGAE